MLILIIVTNISLHDFMTILNFKLAPKVIIV